MVGDAIKIKSMFTKKSFLITFILGIYVMCLMVGYAFFKESLTINGVASTVDYYEGEKLPVTAILRDASNNYYFTANFDSSYLFSYKNESWKDDTYVLNLDKTVLMGLEDKEITYTISFSNPTTLNYTNGVISTEVIGNTTDISLTSGMLSKTEVAPGEVVDVSFSIKIDGFNVNNDSSAKATITYTYQNKPRYLNFIVNFSSKVDYENLFNDDMLLNPYNKNSIQKTEEGYLINKYSITYYTAYQPLFKQFVENLEPGTYMIVRDYQGDMNVSNGLITLRSGTGSDDIIVRCEYGKGIKSVTFTLTQEQIDSISMMYIYGNSNGSNVFKFIQFRKVS